MIPDVHVTRRMDELGLAEPSGGPLTYRAYREADRAMRRCAEALWATADKLDALWSRGSGGFGRWRSMDKFGQGKR